MIVDACGEIPGSAHTLPQPTLSEARDWGWASLPTLTVSDAKRGVYHDRCVSDARNPQRIFDTLWMLVRSDLFVYMSVYQHSRVAPRRDPTAKKTSFRCIMLIINILTASKMLKETSDCFGKVYCVFQFFTNLIFLDGLGFIPSTTRSYNHGCQPDTCRASLRSRHRFPTFPLLPLCCMLFIL